MPANTRNMQGNNMASYLTFVVLFSVVALHTNKVAGQFYIGTQCSCPTFWTGYGNYCYRYVTRFYYNHNIDLLICVCIKFKAIYSWKIREKLPFKGLLILHHYSRSSSIFLKTRTRFKTCINIKVFLFIGLIASYNSCYSSNPMIIH